MSVGAQVVCKVVAYDADYDGVEAEQDEPDYHVDADGQSWNGQVLLWHDIECWHCDNN